MSFVANGKGRKKRVKQPPVLFDKTQPIIREIEKRLRAPFITYWNSVNGSVCQNDVMGFSEILRSVGRHDRIYLFLKSDGGTGTASLRIVHLLRQYARRLVVLVPMECASAATMIALGADEIRMGDLAYLTAIDTSLTHDLSPVDVDNSRVSVGLDEVSRVVRLWRQERRKGDANPYQCLFSHIHPLVIGAVDRASSLSIKLCNEILSYHLRDPRKAGRIARHLNSAYPAHGYPITFKEARRIGLNVQPLAQEIGDLLIGLNVLYSEMGQRARTDFDEISHHENEILNILEGTNIQVFFQTDKDWYYRKEERRWTSLNDESSWRRIEKLGKRIVRSVFHVR